MRAEPARDNGMFHFLLLTELTTEAQASSASASGDLPVPVMITIILLCLSLPYLIKRKTGKSLDEWLRSITLLERLAKRAEKKKAAEGKSGSALEDKAKKEEQSAAARKREAKEAKNGLMRFVMDVMNLGRRKKLFTIIPGSVRCGKETADLSMLLVTRSRVIGITCRPLDGTIHCHTDGKQWKRIYDGKTTQVNSPIQPAQRNTRLVRQAMDQAGMADIPYETVVVFTGRSVTFMGEKPDMVMKAERFFEYVQTPADLTDGKIEPKTLGEKLNTLVDRTQAGTR